MNTTVIDMSRAKVEREPVSDSTGLVAVIERAARDPSIDIDKMERLLVMQERILARDAEAQFNSAMAACQAEMPQIVAKSENSQTNSLYAALEEIDRIARPIYTKHGFALSFGTEDCPLAGFYRQTCKVSHSSGHSEMRHADLPIDNVGLKGTPNKTGVQGFGSTMSYGQRYITKLVFNIVVGAEDNDGNTGSNPAAEAIKALRQQAKEYAERFVAAVEVGLEQPVNDLCEELQGHSELYQMIWGQLPSQIRRTIKDIREANKPEGEKA